jgi:alpha-D-ribose 1-methylphosphonate 5-triphosphate synthase subunit PhnI
VGYTSVHDHSGAVAAAARLVEAAAPAPGRGWAGWLPLLIDQVMAEAGVHEPRIAELALDQAGGDTARACSLIRTWAAVLPRLADVCVDMGELLVERRITPAFLDPPGGQYLGASLDYAQRLLDLSGRASPGSPDGLAAPVEEAPALFPPARAALEREDLLAPPVIQAEAVDISREAGERTERGALLQLLARAESGAMTALAYSAVRGYGALQDPTLVELRSGFLPVRVPAPEGGEVTIGEVPATVAEIVLYRTHAGVPDPRLTLGLGATIGRLDRRAISAALLDATTTRAAADPPATRAPCEDAEFLSIVLDAQEATGFVEHLKLAHHVTFTSELDRVRSAR